MSWSSTKPLSVANLAKQISAAFAGLAPPGDGALLHPQCMDDVDVVDFYGALQRADLTDPLIVRNYAALTSFSAEAFRYYIPAYMLWTLGHLEAGDIANESTLLALDPGTDREMLHDFRLSKFTLFTPPQVAATRAFLGHVSEHPYLGEFADLALINHWLNA